MSDIEHVTQKVKGAFYFGLPATWEHDEPVSVFLNELGHRACEDRGGEFRQNLSDAPRDGPPARAPGLLDGSTP